MKKYFKCTITTKQGRVFENPLRLDEFLLIRKMLKDNKSVVIEEAEAPEAWYNTTFGIQSN